MHTPPKYPAPMTRKRRIQRNIDIIFWVSFVVLAATVIVLLAQEAL